MSKILETAKQNIKENIRSILEDESNLFDTATLYFDKDGKLHLTEFEFFDGDDVFMTIEEREKIDIIEEMETYSLDELSEKYIKKLEKHIEEIKAKL